MSVLSRAALEASPLADLHEIASELGIDGFRRLRKAELVDRIVAHQGGDEAGAEPSARPRRRRGGRGRGRAGDADEERADEERGDEDRADDDVAAESEDAEDERDLVQVEGEAGADADEEPRE